MFSGKTRKIVIKDFRFISNMDYIEELEKVCKLKGYSKDTFRSYSYFINDYINFTKKTSLNLNNESVKSYLLTKDVKTNTSRLAYASLRFFFTNILNRPFTTEQVPIKKKEKQLPKVISKKRILEIISNTKNLKHKIIIKLLYSTGMRLSELINLKRCDINFENNTVKINKGKGKKDRITIISKSLQLDLLKYYSKSIFKTDYLLEGRSGKYSKKSVQLVLKKHNIHPHPAFF